jgi:hypothetical protein
MLLYGAICAERQVMDIETKAFWKEYAVYVVGILGVGLGLVLLVFR